LKAFEKYSLSRRNFIRTSLTATATISLFPLTCLRPGSVSARDISVEQLPSILKRKFGSFDFDVTTMGLGGQAGVQWPPSGTNPVAIVIKAIKLGINYFDTSNLYGKSQINFHQAFVEMNLIPGEPNYDENLRKSIWITSKTHMRWGNPGYPELPVVSNTSNGKPNVKCAIDDLKRSLTQIFGDNKGNYPEGSYLDMMLIHSVKDTENINVLYEGLETPLNASKNFGALVALRDFRDGTNLTGMNPKNEKLIRHIGFSGHTSPPVMVDMIQRDEYGILEAVLVAINSNDKTKYNMQHNLIPVASAKGMGIIAMKVFADAAMYHKAPKWSSTPDDVFLEIGTPELPSRPLIEYSLTIPGVHTAIIGIGHIDEDAQKCQLIQNFYAAQIEADGISEPDRKKTEELTEKLKPKSNYFQISKVGLTPPRNLRKEGNRIFWDNAFAGDSPLKAYEILVNGEKVGEVPHQPQILKSKPFTYDISLNPDDKVEIAAVDQIGNRAVELLVNISSAAASSNKNRVLLYPNPCQTELTVSNIESPYSIVSIYSASGIKLIEKAANGSQAKFDVSKLPKGNYYVKFINGSSEKFVKL
jgi:aryl-alcohol dehydrogenase-like predicted oxidoreductase